MLGTLFIEDEYGNWSGKEIVKLGLYTVGHQVFNIDYKNNYIVFKAVMEKQSFSSNINDIATEVNHVIKQRIEDITHLTKKNLNLIANFIYYKHPPLHLNQIIKDIEYTCNILREQKKNLEKYIENQHQYSEITTTTRESFTLINGISYTTEEGIKLFWASCPPFKANSNIENICHPIITKNVSKTNYLIPDILIKSAKKACHPCYLMQ